MMLCKQQQKQPANTEGSVNKLCFRLSVRKTQRITVLLWFQRADPWAITTKPLTWTQNVINSSPKSPGITKIITRIQEHNLMLTGIFRKHPDLRHLKRNTKPQHHEGMERRLINFSVPVQLRKTQGSIHKFIGTTKKGGGSGGRIPLLTVCCCYCLRIPLD